MYRLYNILLEDGSSDLLLFSLWVFYLVVFYNSFFGYYFIIVIINLKFVLKFKYLNYIYLKF